MRFRDRLARIEGIDRRCSRPAGSQCERGQNRTGDCQDHRIVAESMSRTSYAPGQRLRRIGSLDPERMPRIRPWHGEPVDWFEIVAKLEAGDDAALLRLTDLVASVLVRIGAYRSEERLEDLIQEVTLALVQSVRRAAIAERDRFVAYAWSVVRNRWINHLKARSRREARDVDVDPEDLAAGDLAPGAPGGETEARDPGMRIDLERAPCRAARDERLVIEASLPAGAVLRRGGASARASDGHPQAAPVERLAAAARADADRRELYVNRIRRGVDHPQGGAGFCGGDPDEAGRGADGAR